MKNKTPLLIIFTISVGLLSLFAYSTIFINSLKSYEETGSENNEESENIEIVILGKDNKSRIKNDTIKLKEGITNVSFVNVPKEGEMKNSFTLNFAPKTMIYVVFHSMYISVSIVIMFIMIFLIWRMIQEFGFSMKSKDLIWSLSSILILLVLSILLMELINTNTFRLFGGAKIMNFFGIIFDDPANVVRIISISLSVVALVPLPGIALINILASKVANSTLKDKESRLKNLRGYLHSIVFFSGLIVAGTVIGTSLQREMIAEYLTNINFIYPNEFIAVYGMSFTFILGMFFIPTLLYLKHCERELQSDEVSKDEKPSWLEIGKDTMKEVKIVFSIFLPLKLSKNDLT